MTQQLLVVLDKDQEIYRAEVPGAPLCHAMSCLTPHVIRSGYEAAYREHFGIVGGRIADSYYSNEQTGVPGEQRVWVAVHRIGLDGMSRIDPASERLLTFRLLCS